MHGHAGNEEDEENIFSDMSNIILSARIVGSRAPPNEQEEAALKKLEMNWPNFNMNEVKN